MNRIAYIILFFSFIFCLDSPSDKYLNSMDVINKIGDELSSDITIVDDKGQSIQIGQFFNDKPTVLAMAYYNCPMLCTMVLNGLSEVINGSKLIPGMDYNVLTVSIDPTEKTILAKEKKNNYINKYFKGSKGDFWTFATAESKDIELLANELGFQYSYDSYTKQYAHPAVIYIISNDGIVSHHLFGVAPTVNDFSMAITEASDGKFASIFDKILLYCYKYDPEAGSYTLVATNVMKVAGVSTMFVMASFLSFFWYRESKV